MVNINPVIEKLSHARTRCTLCIPDAERHLLKEQAIGNMGKNLTLKGFRPGKAPPDVVREHCGEEHTIEEIVHLFLGQKLPSLLKTQNLTPILPPKVELISHTPITLRITIVEKPSVKFHGNDALRITKKEIIVTDEEVTKTLDTLKKEHAIAEWTDAAVQKQWGIPSIEKLRTSIVDALKRQKEHAERRRREEAFFTQIQKSTDVDLAPELLENEERHMLESMQENIRSQNLSFTEWLKRTGKSEDIVRQELQEEAKRQLRLRFGIDALLIEHHIMASEKETTEERGEDADRRRWQSRIQKLLALFLE